LHHVLGLVVVQTVIVLKVIFDQPDPIVTDYLLVAA
jgi:hypothetical protein